MKGVLRTKSDNRRLIGSFEAFLDSIEVIGFDLKASLNASNISANLLKAGKAINAMDCLIAGSMLSNHCKKIITMDKNHFGRIKGLVIEGY